LQQLADYGAFHDEEQGYIDVDDVLAAGTSVSPSDASVYVVPRRSSRFGVWVAIAAVVLTVLLIGVIPFLVNSGADTVVATTLAESTPTTLAESAPTTVVESTPTTLGELVLIPGTWSRVPHDEAVFGGGSSLNSVTVGGPGLVAVGEDEGTVLTSVDGITWSRVPYDEVVFGGSTMSSVAAGGPGLVAVGWVGQAVDTFEGDRAAAVWTSVDGVTWSRVPHDEAVFGGAGGQWINSVTVGGPGLVAVGSVQKNGDEAAAVWTSVDGLMWSRVPHDEAVFGGVGGQGMSSVTVGGPGLVAVGVGAGRMSVDEGEVDWEVKAAVWTGGQGMSSVTVGGPGLVAVGSDQPGDDVPSGRAQDAAVWTSVDGVTWSRVPHDVTLFGGTGSQSGDAQRDGHRRGPGSSRKTKRRRCGMGF
jgi:hypothetical protein